MLGRSGIKCSNLRGTYSNSVDVAISLHIQFAVTAVSNLICINQSQVENEPSVCESPALNKSLEIQRFERSDTIEVMFVFYPRRLHVYCYSYALFTTCR